MLLLENSTHPLVSELAIAVVSRALDGKGHCTDHQGPLNTNFVHNRATHEANYIAISSLNILEMGSTLVRHIPTARRA